MASKRLRPIFEVDKFKAKTLKLNGKKLGGPRGLKIGPQTSGWTKFCSKSIFKKDSAHPKKSLVSKMIGSSSLCYKVGFEL